MNLRFGIISEVDIELGRARVKFAEDSIVSPWLPVSQKKTLSDKYFYAPDINEFVWCIMDEHLESGVIGGSIYNSEDKPGNVKGKDISGVEFSDGTKVSYDRENRKLSVVIDDTELDISTDGYTIKRADESLKSILTDLIAAIEQQTHATGTGPSGPPLNLAAFTLIKNRIPNLFEN